MKLGRTSVGLLTVLSVAAAAAQADWPQWNGVNRDGKSLETGLLKQWPDGGPKLLWTADTDIGGGFSSPSVTAEAIYVTGLVGKDGWLFAFDLAGKSKWKHNYGPDWSGQHAGVRTTPTVDGDRLYLMSGQGRIVCIETATGKEKWGFNAIEKFGGRNIKWGIAESPLVYGNTVVCTPGGRDASLVGLDKMTGRTLWTTKGLSDLAGYCSPLLIKEGSRNLIVTATENNIVGVGPDDGRVFWKVPYRNKWAAHPNTPLYHDGSVFVTSNYGLGGMMLRLSQDGKSVTEAWRERSLDTHHGGVVLVNGCIYGSASRGHRMCLDWKTGKIMYRTDRPHKGSVIAADGMLYCYDESGSVCLVEASPKGYNVVSSFKVTQGAGNHWAHPVIAGGRLYIRHGGVLMAHDIKGKDYKAAARGDKQPADSPAAELVKDQQEVAAENKLKMARMYLRMGMKNKAQQELAAIVETYGRTEAAKQAAKELADLKQN